MSECFGALLQAHVETMSRELEVVVNQDKAPVPTQQIVQELKEIIPLLSAPYMIHRFHANRATKETSDKVSAFQLEVSGRTEGSHKVWHVLETLSLLGASDHRNPASQRLTPPLTSGGARAEIDQQLVRL